MCIRDRFGFISVEHLNLIQKLLDKSYKWGLTNRMYNSTLLFSTRDCQLFKLMRSSSHCLHHLLPPVLITEMFVFTRKALMLLLPTKSLLICFAFRYDDILTHPTPM